MTQRKPRKRKLRVLSLYTGAGGLDLGLEAAGFEIALCIEADDDCRKTLQQNRPSWTLANPGDVLEITPAQALEQAGLRQKELTLLAGGPPCQPFSKSSYWLRGDARRLEDPRARTLGRYFDFVEGALPRVLLLENVRGLVYSGKDEGLRLLQDRLNEINAEHGVKYEAEVVTLNCADYGVPQRRERVFIVAERTGKKLAAPEATHVPPDKITNGEDRYRTAWDAIGDLDVDEWPEHLNASGKWAELLPSIPEGENYLWHTPRREGEPLFGWRTRFWSFLLKLAKDQPSWTIQAVPGPATGPFHWRNRRLSTRELCRLQTFPDNFEVAGEYLSQQRQIGNAVPPVVAERLGREIRRQLLGERPHQRAKFVPPARDDCPCAEETSPVPRKYLRFRGKHADHPGIGLGPGARERSEGEPSVG